MTVMQSELRKGARGRGKGNNCSDNGFVFVLFSELRKGMNPQIQKIKHTTRIQQKEIRHASNTVNLHNTQRS